MGRQPNPAERVAFEVVRRVTGAAVEHFDTAGRQSAVDGLIHYQDGPAALEVTMLTDPSARQVEQLLSADDFTWRCPGASWWWTLQVEPGASLRAIRAELCTVIEWCERHGVTNPSVRAYVHGLPDAGRVVRWIESSRIDLYGHPDVKNHPGEVMVVPASKGGAVGDLSQVVPWLNAELQEPRTRRKVDKLAGAGRERGELFLIVDDTGAPFAGFYAMAFGDGVPDDDPAAPDPVDSVWLAPRWSQVVLRWERGAGWSRHNPYDSPEQLTNA